MGFVAVRYVDEDAARAGEIEMVAVAPGCQRAGVGTSLVHQAVTEIKAAGVDLGGWCFSRVAASAGRTGAGE